MEPCVDGRDDPTLPPHVAVHSGTRSGAHACGIATQPLGSGHGAHLSQRTEDRDRALAACVQMDGTSSVREWAKRRLQERSWCIGIQTRPLPRLHCAQYGHSSDVGCEARCKTRRDLAFFRALAASVAKQRRGIENDQTQFDLEKLSEDVQAAFAAYSPDTLDAMWAYKSEVMQKIIEAEGGNWYDKRKGTDAHGRKRPRGE